MLGRYARLGPLAAPGAADRAAVEAALERCDAQGLVGAVGRLALRRRVAAGPAGPRAGPGADARWCSTSPPRRSMCATRWRLLELIRTLVDGGLAGLVITHHLNLAARFADRMLLLERGPAGRRRHAAPRCCGRRS